MLKRIKLIDDSREIHSREIRPKQNDLMVPVTRPTWFPQLYLEHFIAKMEYPIVYISEIQVNLDKILIKEKCISDLPTIWFFSVLPEPQDHFFGLMTSNTHANIPHWNFYLMYTISHAGPGDALFHLKLLKYLVWNKTELYYQQKLKPKAALMVLFFYMSDNYWIWVTESYVTFNIFEDRQKFDKLFIIVTCVPKYIFFIFKIK
jgi:hypothetical protein